MQPVWKIERVSPEIRSLPDLLQGIGFVRRDPRSKKVKLVILIMRRSLKLLELSFYGFISQE